MKITEIFTPNDTPTVTYVNRAEHKFEQTLREHYETPKMIISISGPSKSGKTVLIEKVVPEDHLIPIKGAGISSAENLWDRVLHWMGAPSQVTKTTSASNAVTVSGEAAGKLKLPLVAEGGAKLAGSGSHTSAAQTTRTERVGGLPQVVEEIANSDFAVFIDDFHYIKAEVQGDIGRNIKSAAESGVKIITASVPHRAEDVVRSNSELRGRVAAINLPYWTTDELIQIARKGFAALNTELSPARERQLALEAQGSPQLMQSICLNLCHVLQIKEELAEQARTEVSDEQVKETLQRTSAYTDFTKMLDALHKGPRTRGQERKLHDLTDGSRGDVYRAILVAIKSADAGPAFSYEDMLGRVRAVCPTEPPVGSSIASALEQMAVLAEEVQPNASPISWDGDTLNISDPYLLFYLRCSDKLAELAAKRRQ